MWGEMEYGKVDDDHDNHDHNTQETRQKVPPPLVSIWLKCKLQERFRTVKPNRASGLVNAVDFVKHERCDTRMLLRSACEEAKKILKKTENKKPLIANATTYCAMALFRCMCENWNSEMEKKKFDRAKEEWTFSDTKINVLEEPWKPLFKAFRKWLDLQTMPQKMQGLQELENALDEFDKSQGAAAVDQGHHDVINLVADDEEAEGARAEDGGMTEDEEAGGARAQDWEQAAVVQGQEPAAVVQGRSAVVDHAEDHDDKVDIGRLVVDVNTQQTFGKVVVDIHDRIEDMQDTVWFLRDKRLEDLESRDQKLDKLGAQVLATKKQLDTFSKAIQEMHTLLQSVLSGQTQICVRLEDVARRVARQGASDASKVVAQGASDASKVVAQGASNASKVVAQGASDDPVYTPPSTATTLKRAAGSGADERKTKRTRLDIVFVQNKQGETKELGSNHGQPLKIGKVTVWVVLNREQGDLHVHIYDTLACTTDTRVQPVGKLKVGQDTRKELTVAGHQTAATLTYTESGRYKLAFTQV